MPLTRSSELTRRSFVRAAGAMGLLALAPRSFVRAAGAMELLALAPPDRVSALLSSPPASGEPGRFLSAHEIATLRALTDRLIPGPPEDGAPAALQAGVAEAIDLLLAAFELFPPLIHAGGPFSGRTGSRRDDFAHFVGLDRQAELGWRIRLQGSRGIRRGGLPGRSPGFKRSTAPGSRISTNAHGPPTVATSRPSRPRLRTPCSMTSGIPGCSSSWAPHWPTRSRRCMDHPSTGGIET